MSEMRFDDKVVIVTGAGRGIGRAEAEFFAARGANVVVCDLGSGPAGEVTTEDPASEVVAAITAAGGTAVASRESVATREGSAAIVAAAVNNFGGVDVLVNNAGIYSLEEFEDLTPEYLQRKLDVHVMGTMLMSKAAWPHLVRSGSGRVVNTISAAMLGVKLSVGYGTAKGGVFGFTRNLAVAGAPHGVRVNAIAPGAGTRLSDLSGPALAPGMAEHMRQTMPAELVAPVTAFLGHADCTITGEVLACSGGGVARLAVVKSRGIRDENLSPEMVRERLGEVLDLEGAVLEDPNERAARNLAAASAG